jgi:hypothetical protein
VKQISLNSRYQIRKISKAPTGRDDVMRLNDLLNEQLTLRQARPDGICPVRRELAIQCFGKDVT